MSDVAEAVRAAYRGEPLLAPGEVKRVLKHLEERRDEDAHLRTRLDRLTARQLEILQEMAEGRSPSEIAERLGISRHTLRTHVQNILTKLGVHSKLQALAHAIRFGKVEARGPLP